MRALIVALCLLAACRIGSSHTLQQVEIRVTDDHGEPLAEVPVEVHQHIVASTDGEGRAAVSVAVVGNGGASIRALCPEAYRPSDPRVLAANGAAPQLLQFQCRPRLRTLAVVVNAPSAIGAALQADGRPLGKVGTDGTLHAVLKRRPGSQLRLLLDAPAARAVKELVVPDRDEIVLFDPLLASAAVAPNALQGDTARVAH